MNIKLSERITPVSFLTSSGRPAKSASALTRCSFYAWPTSLRPLGWVFLRFPRPLLGSCVRSSLFAISHVRWLPSTGPTSRRSGTWACPDHSFCFTITPWTIFGWWVVSWIMYWGTALFSTFGFWSSSIVIRWLGLASLLRGWLSLKLFISGLFGRFRWTVRVTLWGRLFFMLILRIGRSCHGLCLTNTVPIARSSLW